MIGPIAANRRRSGGVPGPQLGEEQAVNGAFDSDTSWTKRTGIAIAGGECVFTAVASGQWVRQVMPVTIDGPVYRVQFDVIECSTGGFQIRAGSAIGGGVYSVPGTYAEHLVPNGASIGVRAAGTTTGKIDNVSVKQVL